MIPWVYLANKSDTDLNQFHTSWDDLVRFLTAHVARPDKDGPAMIPVRLKDPDHWVRSPGQKGRPGSFRNDQNVAAVTLAVIDLDRPGALAQAEAKFKGYEYLVYSTYSHTRSAPYKYRMALRLAEEIPAKEWPSAWAALVSGVNADPACKNTSRLYYLPAYNPSNRIAPVARHNKGKPLTRQKISDWSKDLVKQAEAEQRERDRRWQEDAQAGRLKRRPGGWLNRDDIQGMEQRHARLVESLRSGCGRHDFALRVVAREVTLRGATLNEARLSAFIAHALDTYTDRPATSGNTLHEIPHMLATARAKFGATCSHENY